MDKIKVIIKRPDEKAGHVTWISNTLANLQRTVDGPFHDIIVGTVILCGQDGEEFGDVPIDMKTWKFMLKKLGNEL